MSTPSGSKISFRLHHDEIEAAPEVALGAFLRCGRGEPPTDHQTLVLAELPSGRGFNHTAVEVKGSTT